MLTLEKLWLRSAVYQGPSVKLCLIAVALLFPLVATGSAYAQKIASSSGSITMNEGSLQTVQFSLDAPIICPVGAPTCEVDLTFNNTDPAHVSLSTPGIVWQANEWTQVRTVNISAPDDGIYNSGVGVAISATAVSSSVYYNGFHINIPITVNNIDPMPPAPGVIDKTVNVPSNTATTVDVLSGISGNPDTTTLAIIVGPTHGTAVDPPNTITYTPNIGYSGPDSLVYSVCSLFGPSVCSTARLDFSVASQVTAATTTSTAPNTGYGTPAQPVLLPALGDFMLAALSITVLCIGLRPFIPAKLFLRIIHK